MGSEHAWLGRVRLPRPSSSLPKGTAMPTLTPFLDPESPPETVTGLLDIRDKTAFLRAGYLPGPADRRVPLGQVRAHGLRSGDLVVGAAELATVRTVNGDTRWRGRPH